MSSAILRDQLHTGWSLLKETAAQWSDDKAARLGAALAYYAVFSLGPLLIIAIAVAGLVFGEQAVQGQVFQQLRWLIGDNAAQTVQGLIAGAHKPSSGILATVISVVTLLVAATGVIVQLKDALNTIWGVKAKPGRGLRSFLRDYVISLAALLGVGFILIVSLLLTTALAVLGKYWGDILPLPEGMLHLFNFIVSFCVLALLFALMFKALPDVKIAWRDVWIGAIGTTLLFNLGKTLIGVYLGKQSFDSTYGAAASIVAVLVWVYYLSQVLFFGAEFTKVYAKSRGAAIEPTDAAVPVNAEERVKQGLPPRQMPTKTRAPPARSHPVPDPAT